MLRVNRSRLAYILLLTGFIYFLYHQSSSSTDFRKNTEAGLAKKKHGILRGDLSDEDLRDETQAKLQRILQEDNEHKQPTTAEGILAATEPQHQRPTVEDLEALGWTREEPKKDLTPDGSKKSDADDVTVAGRKSIARPKYPTDSKGDEELAIDKDTVKASADPATDIARQKLMEYLKKRPVVIFSKSYCPHSRRAKQLLLEIYKIDPEPLVVELDQLTDKLPLPPGEEGDDNEGVSAPTLGRKIQDLLATISGRRTVPNIMIKMISIGGNDNIWEMHEKGTLADEIREKAGKLLKSIELVESKE